MKQTKKPTHLRLLPPPDPDYLSPSWESEKATPAKDAKAIIQQMDKLHSMTSVLFLSLILLELTLSQLSGMVYDLFGMPGAIALMVIAMVFGLAGVVLTYFMATIEANVRRELNVFDDTEDDWHEEELDYV